MERLNRIFEHWAKEEKTELASVKIELELVETREIKRFNVKLDSASNCKKN